MKEKAEGKPFYTSCRDTTLIGRLKTAFDFERGDFLLEFQSLIGRLKTASRSVTSSSVFAVSIPHR